MNNEDFSEVVGGGFTGLYTTYELGKLGHRATVFERNTVPAEKTLTKWVDKKPVELGTCYASADYDPIFKLAEELGVEKTVIRDKYKFSERSLGAVSRRGLIGGLRWGLGFPVSFWRYYSGWKGLMDRFEAGDPKTVEELSQPVAPWLEAKGMSSLSALFTMVCDAYGYGPSTSVPAYYPVRFISPGLIQTVATRRFWKLMGWGTAIDELAARVDLRLKTPITSAHFNPDRREWTVWSGNKRFGARHLIVACSPHVDPVRNFFDDERAEMLASGVNSTRYMCVHLEAENWFENERMLLVEEAGARDVLGSARRDSAIENGRARYVAAAMLSEEKSMTAEDIAANSVARDGGKLVKVLDLNVLETFNTHFTGAAMAAGQFHRFRELQGKDNLWVVNSLLAQENWRDLSRLCQTVCIAVSEDLAAAGPGLEAPDLRAADVV